MNNKNKSSFTDEEKNELSQNTLINSHIPSNLVEIKIKEVGKQGPGIDDDFDIDQAYREGNLYYYDKNWPIENSKINKLIEDAKQEKQKIDAGTSDEKYSLLAITGDNCLTWAIKKLNENLDIKIEVPGFLETPSGYCRRM
jgi:hypothetical protein